MNLSAIYVVTDPLKTINLISTLNEISNIEVFHQDENSGKIIVIQEAESIHDEVQGLKKIKSISGVIMAEMVEHYFGEDKMLYPDLDLEKIDKLCGTQTTDSCIPAYLNQ